jgi:hypothetical protein
VSTKQRIVIWFGVLSLVAMAAYPPWHIQIWRRQAVTSEVPSDQWKLVPMTGSAYGWIFKPPAILTSDFPGSGSPATLAARLDYRTTGCRSSCRATGCSLLGNYRSTVVPREGAINARLGVAASNPSSTHFSDTTTNRNSGRIRVVGLFEMYDSCFSIDKQKRLCSCLPMRFRMW